MRYLGGKHRQAKAIEQVVRELKGSRTRYVEPFIGGGSVFSRVAPLFDTAIGADASPSLVELWRASVIDRWEPPVTMDKATWLSQQKATDSALRAWAGYAASYNGKWFAGYGPTAAGRDYLAESARGLARKVSPLHAHPGISFVCADFATHHVDSNTVVYCDPPYEGTETYKAAEPFDHARFWSTMNAWHFAGALVLVHEYAAPEGWHVVHETNRVETMHHGGPSSGVRKERLFTRAD